MHGINKNEGFILLNMEDSASGFKKAQYHPCSSEQN